jgi:hypothetical protein
VSETDRVFVAGEQRGVVEGVRGGGGEGLDGTSVIGDDSYDDGGWRGRFGGCGFRHGGEFGGELKFDAM